MIMSGSAGWSSSVNKTLKDSSPWLRLPSNSMNMITSQTHQQLVRSSCSLLSDQLKKPFPLSTMEYVEKNPVSPPSYSTAHQKGASTRFPVYEQNETYILPEYSPTIYKISLVLRKAEFVTPYELSSNRSWKTLAIELNSTQLNFYTIDNLPFNRIRKSSKKNQRLTEVEQEFVVNTLSKNPSKYLTPRNLVASYTLQHAKFGIPIDYKKRNYCLRMRLETEQMIVQFISLTDMIDWANYLSIGINVSLDLDTREMPKDRTVPRRRRRRSHRHRSYSDSELIRRELSGPVNNYGTFSRQNSVSEPIKSKIYKIFGRKRSNSERAISAPDLTIHQPISTHESILQTQLAIRKNSYNSRSGLDSYSDEGAHSSDISTIREEEEELEELEEELEEEEEEEEGLSTGLDDIEDEIPDNEIHSVRQLHYDSDEESIEENTDSSNALTRPMTVFTSLSFPNSNRLSIMDSSNSYESDEEIIKWIPDKKQLSKRKLLKDSIRCIKILPNDECWVGKNILRETNPPSFRTCNEHNMRKNPRNKFLKEFVVGPHGLLLVS